MFRNNRSHVNTLEYDVNASIIQAQKLINMKARRYVCTWTTALDRRVLRHYVPTYLH